MKIITLRSHINTLILVAILILNTLFHSEIGGPDTIFNTISFLLVVVFLLLNLRFNGRLSLFFAAPVLFLLLSVIVHIATLPSGGFRSALATIAGYTLLMLRPLPLNIVYLRRYILLYLFACLAISIGFTLDDLRYALVFGNRNFNINPNAASAFFLSCLMLSFIFLESTKKWVLSIAYSLLILTTGSRAGILSSLFCWGLYLWLATDNQSRRAVFRTRVMVVASFITVLVLAVYLVPDFIDYFATRITSAGLVGIESSHGGFGRNEIWNEALRISDASLFTMLFGTGPATTALLVGRGAHSSYVAAISSNGYPFMVFTMLAILVLLHFHIKLGNRQFLVFALPILVYGAVQEMLFVGIGSLWYIFIFLSLYYRSSGVRLPSAVYGKKAAKHLPRSQPKLADRPAGKLIT